MKNLLKRMSKKKWGLPLWAWAGISAAAGWLLLRQRAAPGVEPTQTAAEVPTSLAGPSDTGDLTPGGDSGGAPPPTGAADPLFDPGGPQTIGDLGGNGGSTSNGGTDESTGDSTAEAVEPHSGLNFDLGAIGSILKMPHTQSSRTRPTKTKKAKKPKKTKPVRTGSHRSAPSHGSGSAGARPRPARKAPKRRAPRPRRPVRPDDRGGPRTTARPKPKPKRKVRKVRRGRPH